MSERVLIKWGSDARYVPTGHLVYVRAETLLAVSFDLERLEVTSGPVPTVEGIKDASNRTDRCTTQGYIAGKQAAGEPSWD